MEPVYRPALEAVSRVVFFVALRRSVWSNSIRISTNPGEVAMFRLALLIASAVCSLLVVGEHALAQESWVGKEIIIKQGGIKIGDTDKKRQAG
jgi:hypothetical protein